MGVASPESSLEQRQTKTTSVMQAASKMTMVITIHGEDMEKSFDIVRCYPPSSMISERGVCLKMKLLVSGFGSMMGFRLASCAVM